MKPRCRRKLRCLIFGHRYTIRKIVRITQEWRWIATCVICKTAVAVRDKKFLKWYGTLVVYDYE